MTNRNDKTGQFVPPTRTVATGVVLYRHSYVADTVANLKALDPDIVDDGMTAVVSADGSNWRFDSSSTAQDGTNNLIISPDAGLGKWMRADKTVPMKFAVGFGSADAEVLLTVPAGVTLQLQDVFWEVTTSWTGGSSSAIGISSADAPHDTQGDLLGGAVGSVAAEITSTIGFTSEPRGASFTAAPFTPVLAATDTIRFDRITSVFTAGAGFVHVIAAQIETT